MKNLSDLFFHKKKTKNIHKKPLWSCGDIYARQKTKSITKPQNKLGLKKSEVQSHSMALNWKYCWYNWLFCNKYLPKRRFEKNKYFCPNMTFAPSWNGIGHFWPPLLMWYYEKYIFLLAYINMKRKTQLWTVYAMDLSCIDPQYRYVPTWWRATLKNGIYS